MESAVQAVLVPRTYTLGEATMWMYTQGYVTTEMTLTEDYYRFKQLQPSLFKRFTLQMVDNDVFLILGWIKWPTTYQ